ncbi:MAG: chorismate-binding protein [Muribaculaceae bacterium]|nr:chorismate-binding protein [Muribaculaceae bacterium]
MNFYRITFPKEPDGKRHTFLGKSMTISHKPGEGFIFAPFLDASRIVRIPATGEIPEDSEMTAWAIENDHLAGIPGLKSVDAEQHLTLISDAVKFVKEMEQHTGQPSKVVAARISVAETGKSPAELHAALAEAYPKACVFLFSTSVSGTWIGASPELLFSLTRSDGTLRSMALAGTRPAGSEGNWDDKNVAEQRMVTDFITGTLKQCGLNPTVSTPYTRRAGRIEHICTDIISRNPLSVGNDPGNEAARIAASLSPTPALCGTPREEACRFIKSHEGFSRDFYGGYVGFVSRDEARLYVNLRSGRMLCGMGKIILYAGGGITRDSNPKDEWVETERKLATMLTIL